MSDLVRRLRGYPGKRGMEKPFHVTMHEAADYIEKLEAALAHIYAWYPVSVSDPTQTIKDIREFARKALEEES
jgi:hypothetical protein